MHTHRTNTHTVLQPECFFLLSICTGGYYYCWWRCSNSRRLNSSGIRACVRRAGPEPAVGDPPYLLSSDQRAGTRHSSSSPHDPRPGLPFHLLETLLEKKRARHSVRGRDSHLSVCLSVSSTHRRGILVTWSPGHRLLNGSCSHPYSQR